MARRTGSMAKTKKRIQESLDYHEGLSPNQVKIILREFGLEHKLDMFGEWMYGQTAPLLIRHDEKNRHTTLPGTYEYDLFRWIANQKKGEPLIWD